MRLLILASLAKPAAQPAPAPAATASPADIPKDFAYWDAQSYTAVKLECEARGISTIGNKATLIMKLV